MVLEGPMYMYHSPLAQERSEEIVLTHTTMKGFEVGLLIGSIIGGVMSFKSKSFQAQKLTKYFNYSILTGICLADSLALAKIYNQFEKNKKRAYQLHRNTKENNTDNCTGSGLVLGYFILRRVPVLKEHKLLSAYLGGTAGFLGAKVYNRFV